MKSIKISRHLFLFLSVFLHLQLFTALCLTVEVLFPFVTQH